MVSKALAKYIKGYAEPEINQLVGFPASSFYHNSVLIPSYLEDCNFLVRLDTDLPSAPGRILAVVISNHPLGLSPKKEAQAILAHLNIVKFLGKPVWHSHQLTLFERNKYDVLLVNRTGACAIAKDQGVGLARKIGADLLLALINSGSVLSPWIMSTDADTRIPKDYFSVKPCKASSAITYPFEHICNNTELTTLKEATKLYEQSIKHYVDGLSRAGSEYAFSTLGSCLAFYSENYAQVRGFPKRSAGEDFYLLNKLAKVGRVETSDKLPLLKIEARTSDRVPFGTGPAVIKLLHSPSMRDEAIFYSPEIFVQLKQVLEQINQRPKIIEEIQASEIAVQALTTLGIEKAIAHASRQLLSDQQYDLHMKSWFDGFKTLKFVHFLRDSKNLKSYKRQPYSSLSWNQLNNLTPLPKEFLH